MAFELNALLNFAFEKSKIMIVCYVCSFAPQNLFSGLVSTRMNISANDCAYGIVIVL